MANPIQQGLKPKLTAPDTLQRTAAMANPIQQGLKPDWLIVVGRNEPAAMANPIQQGLKLQLADTALSKTRAPQWLIQYNKD